MPASEKRSQSMPNQDSELVCIFCGNARAEILHELPHVWHQPPDSGRIAVRWCDDCAVGFVAPLPSESRLAEFYGSSYFETYGTKLHGKPPAGIAALAWRALTHLAWRLDRSCPVTPEFLSRFAPRGSSVCDLGCGPGHLLKAMRAYGYQACGIEPDPAAVRLCVDQGMEVHVGTAEALPQNLAGRKFDAVVMTQVLEHCRDPRSALRGALGLLRSGGHLIVEVPNAGSRAARESGAAWFHADVGRHLYFFTPKSLAAVTRQVGAAPNSRSGTLCISRVRGFWAVTRSGPPLHDAGFCLRKPRAQPRNTDTASWHWSPASRDPDSRSAPLRPMRCRRPMRSLPSHARYFC